MTWQNILLKQKKFPVGVEDWVDIFESENKLNEFKKLLQHYLDFGGLFKPNDNTLRNAKQDLSRKGFANSIVSEAGFDNKPILGQQPTGKKSDTRIVRQVELHLKEILDSIVGSFGTTKSEQIAELINSIGPKLKRNNPDDYLEIEKEIYNVLGSKGKPSEIRSKLDARIKGKIREISEGVMTFHHKHNNIPKLYKLFHRSETGSYRVSTAPFSDAENLIKFYRVIKRGSVAQIQKLLRKEVGSLYPHLYTVSKEPTDEFKKALQGEEVSLKGFERFGYVDVPISEVNVDIFEDAIKDKKILWIPIDEAEDALDEDPPDGIKGLVGDIGKGKPIVVNGKSILSGNKLPSEKKEILDEFNKFTDKQDKDLKYWAFNNISKVPDWEILTVNVITKFLKDPRKKKNIVDILFNLKMIVKEGE